MKIEVEIDDLVNEDGTLSTAMEDMVVAALVKKVDARALQALQSKAEDRAGEVLDLRVVELLEEWLNKPVTVTDSYGDDVESGPLVELLKARFDDFWNQKVDGRGSPGGYDAKQTRMRWLIDSRIKELCESFARDMAKEVKKQVTAVMSDKLKVAIGGTLIDSIGLPEIIKRLGTGRG